MNILLIGNEGYLGRGLQRFLSPRHNIIGWDKNEDLFKLNQKILGRLKIDSIVNLSLMAERATPKYQINTPGDSVNVMGARHLATILSGSKIPWIQFSTREVFGPVYTKNDVIKTKDGYRPNILVNENQSYAPTNSYGKSKVMAEFISESHTYSNIIRLTTAYTDFDHKTVSWVLQLIKSSVHQLPINLAGGGEQFRDPVHIDDVGDLIERILEKQIYGEIFHAGGGEKNIISLKEFVRRANPLAKFSTTEGGDYGFAFDISKTANLTGWLPKTLIREKISQIIKNLNF